ncbi:MAG: 30S ribosomal protein S7 [Actinomycetia bacterium]|nr:30S ribosomal protein S7 [Actinomycetes bacterium]
MPRKGPVQKREVKKDLIFNEKLISQMINLVLLKGKKGISEKIVYQSLDIVGKRAGEDGVIVLKKAIGNIKPLLEVKPRRVGGATYQVPVEVDERRGITLALRWLISITRSKSGKPVRELLAEEILSAAENTGAAVKKKENLHKMAEANRAFAHYRW